MKEEETTIKTVKTVKGFDHNLQCRGKQYEVGQTYTEEGDIKVCEHGLHAISPDASPLSVFSYYPPSVNGKPSRYCEVEASGNIDSDGEKIAASKLTVGAEIGIPGIVKAHIEWVKQHLIDDDEHKSSNTGFQSSAINTGDQSSASNTGDQSSASNTGFQSSASNTGDQSSASNTGDQSSASNTGFQSSAEVSGKDSVAIATGYHCKARGAIGCAIVVAERGDWNGETYPLIGIKAAIVDGKTIKADTWYTVENGQWKEVTDN